MAPLAFTDTHVHFHDLRHPVLRYGWMEPDAEPDPELGDYSAIKAQRYWPDDFVAETRFNHVAKVVHVEAVTSSGNPVQETRWLQTFSDRIGVPHGIVVAADLAAPDAGEVIRQHCEFANVRGVRDLRRDNYLDYPEWRRGYALLERYDLVCCDAPRVEQMRLSQKLAQSFPGTTLCIDHAGFPRMRTDDYFREWRSGISLIAEAENTVIKISGLGQCDHRWTVKSLRPWVLACVEAFGTERSFFGTNWPVDRLYSSYGDVVAAYREIISDFSEEERHALLSGNANRVFRLDD
jgi:predicted TIM-barrel fold metal-dependent hydrolase